jgi:hypothetical protein
MCAPDYKETNTTHIMKAIKTRSKRWALQVVLVGEMKNSYEILVRKPGEKTSLGRPWL